MTSFRTCAIVPVKAVGLAKRRLSPMLPDAARQRLVLTMLEDVLATLAEVESIDCVIVVTPDARVTELAQRRGATIIPEPGAEELNAAVGSGIAYAISQGIGQALIVPADVPLATASELHSLIQSRGGRPGVTLAPSHDGDGTNGLLLAPPNAIAPCYGPGSYLQHLSQAMARRVDVNVVHLARLAHDIDQPADLRVLAASDMATGERYGFLEPYLAVQQGPGAATRVEDQ